MMFRKIALLLALSLGFAAGAQACGENGAKSGKPDMSKPAPPKPSA
jgi:hypothetical protein